MDGTTDPLIRRHELLAEIRAARVAIDMTRSKQADAVHRQKKAKAEGFEAEMDVVRRIDGAEQRVKEAAEREHTAAADEERYDVGVQAAGQVMKLAEGEMKVLYEKGLSSFIAEAERKTDSALKRAGPVRKALADYRQAWSEAEAHWQQLLHALVARVEAADLAEGRRRDSTTVYRECQVPMFGVQTSDELLARPPRPPAIARLTEK